MAEAVTPAVLDHFTAPPVEASSRLVYVDALRGSAAIGVMLFHLSGHRVAQELWRWLPSGIGSLLQWGELGVQVFFVISGFVIAYSVRDARIDLPYIRRFITRRAIRLEPPYLATIVLVLLSSELARYGFQVSAAPRATPAQVVSHIFYVQRLFGYQDLYPVFWTLSHEVQFYLLFMLVVALGQSVGRGAELTEVPRAAKSPATDRAMLGMSVVWVIGAFGIAAVLSATGAFRANGLCLDTWYLFSLGVLSYGVVFGRVPWQVWLAVVLGMAIFNWDTEQVEPAHKIVGIATAASLIVAGRLGCLHTWGSWRLLQFFAAISYSLYLIHGVVGWRVMSLGERLTGASPAWAAGWFAAALGSAIAAAWLLHRGVERPAIRWLSRRRNHPDASAR